MPKQSRPDADKPETLDAPNAASMKEPAEGSRENVNVSGPDEGERGRSNAGGITNRPLDREENEQAELPPRGNAKEGGHA
jgi:hypothetical protein